MRIWADLSKGRLNMAGSELIVVGFRPSLRFCQAGWVVRVFKDKTCHSTRRSRVLKLRPVPNPSKVSVRPWWVTSGRVGWFRRVFGLPGYPYFECVIFLLVVGAQPFLIYYCSQINICLTIYKKKYIYIYIYIWI